MWLAHDQTTFINIYIMYVMMIIIIWFYQHLNVMSGKTAPLAKPPTHQNYKCTHKQKLVKLNIALKCAFNLPKFLVMHNKL